MTHVHLLRSIPLFAEIDDSGLEWIASQVGEMEAAPDEIIMREGDPCGNFYVLVDGEVQVSKMGRSGQPLILATLGHGSFFGEMSLLTGKSHNATVKALRPARLLKFDQRMFALTMGQFASVSSLLAQALAERAQANEALMRQREKMAALGSLAAGLAHNLNNPAAAGKRAAEQLGAALERGRVLALALAGLGLNAEQLDYLRWFQQMVLEQASHPPQLDPLMQSDLENELANWMDMLGCDGWRLAPTLIEAGLRIEHLGECRTRLPAHALVTVMEWVENTLAVDALVRTMEQTASRVARLVTGVKEYTFMDQAPVQEVSIHDGLEKTLLVLGHRLTDGVQIIRDFDPGLPRVLAFGSELNQVWTSLIDNALDAINGRGTIWLRTSRETNDQVLVEVIDDGAGIPPDVLSRIFEPFYTTKDVGIGLGLGLDVAYRIVVEHHGDIRVTSQPGETRFVVRLPVRAQLDT